MNTSIEEQCTTYSEFCQHKIGKEKKFFTFLKFFEEFLYVYFQGFVKYIEKEWSKIIMTIIVVQKYNYSKIIFKYNIV